MEGKFSWLRKKKKDSPTMLDVVDYRGKEYQVAGGSDKMFILKDLETEEIFRVKGRFKRASEMRDPAAGYVFRRDEGVKVSGTITGKKQK